MQSWRKLLSLKPTVEEKKSTPNGQMTSGSSVTIPDHLLYQNTVTLILEIQKELTDEQKKSLHDKSAELTLKPHELRKFNEDLKKFAKEIGKFVHKKNCSTIESNRQEQASRIIIQNTRKISPIRKK